MLFIDYRASGITAYNTMYSTARKVYNTETVCTIGLHQFILFNGSFYSNVIEGCRFDSLPWHTKDRKIVPVNSLVWRWAKKRGSFPVLYPYGSGFHQE